MQYADSATQNLISERDDACNGEVTDFSFHPVSGELASECGGQWFIGSATPSSVSVKYREQDDFIFSLENRQLLDKDGVQVSLTGESMPAAIDGVHSHPDGGFWLVTLVEANLSRYLLTQEGVLSVEARYTIGRVRPVALNVTLDALGGIYVQGFVGAGISRKGIVRVNSSLSREEYLFEGPSCVNNDFWSNLYSTP